ncbi:MAG: ATP-binding cassette domain-containing protein [Anaerolineae bacterium]
MAEEVLRVRDLSHIYLAGTPMATLALEKANLSLLRGSITAFVGPNGAGKSTLLHFINGLLRPVKRGQVQVFGLDTAARDLDIGALRRRVGLVMQYPHQQLFERYVGDDIAFGPRQLGLKSVELRERVYKAMSTVGLDPQVFIDRHTFSLSGGEMRRTALAGVLAMQPELLILDEVTTGLDPRGRRQVHDLLHALHDKGVTIVFASNDMDEVDELADQAVVFFQGCTVASGQPSEVFRSQALSRWGLVAPAVQRISQELAGAGIPIDPNITRMDELEEALWQAWKA